MKAPPEVVWILDGGSKPALGTRDSQVTVGFPMSLNVTEYEPFSRLAWEAVVDGDDAGSSAYHRRVISPTDDGCHVLTEETQEGPVFLEELGRENRGALYRSHRKWAERRGGADGEACAPSACASSARARPLRPSGPAAAAGYEVSSTPEPERACRRSSTGSIRTVLWWPSARQPARLLTPRRRPPRL